MNSGSKVDLLIIGSGPAGVAAARSYRENGGGGRVVLCSADPDAPYERPPLSKDFLRGSSEEADLQLLAAGELQKLQVEPAGPAVALDPVGRVVTLEDGSAWAYRWCLLATGAAPKQLPVPGGDHPRVLRLRTLADARRLRDEAGAARSAVVVGSGFIGCEAAASLARSGLDVTLVTDEDGPQVRRLGEAVAGRLASWLAAEGVRVITGAEVVSFDVRSDGVVVQLNGSQVRGELALTAVGAAPWSELAAAAGLGLHEGRVLVDAHMVTTVPGVLAAGDVAMAFNTAAGRPLAVEHWGEALTMGEIAGATAAGVKAEWDNAPGFWSEIGDRTLKYAAWGDGYAQARLVDHGEGAFTVWYTDGTGRAVGVLTHEADDDYESGQSLVESAGRPPG